MTTTMINDMTGMYGAMMNTGKQSGNKEGDNTFAELMKTANESLDVTKELTPAEKTTDSYKDQSSSLSETKAVSNTKNDNKIKDDNSAAQKKSDVSDKAEKSSEKNANEKVNDTKQSSTQNQVEKSSETEEIPAEVAETVGTQIVNLFMDILGVDEETIASAMDEMGIGEFDLLNPDVLKDFVVNVKADGDVNALLTDENLLESFKELQAGMEEVILQNADGMQMEPETFKGLLVEQDSQSLFETEVVPSEIITSQKTEQVSVEDKANVEKEISGTEEYSVLEDKSVETNQAPKTSEKEEPKNENREEHKGQSEPLFAQVNAESTSSTNNVLETSSVEPQAMISEQAREILEQVRTQIRADVNDGITELQMKLNPENLGNVHLSLTAKEGAVTAQFATENDTVRQALELQIMQLKENLEQQGVKVEAVEVTVSSHGFEQNLEQGNDGNLSEEQEREALRKATRKINLLNGDGEGELEELTEAEEIAVDMMKADGNSMDYKA